MRPLCTRGGERDLDLSGERDRDLSGERDGEMDRDLSGERDLLETDDLPDLPVEGTENILKEITDSGVSSTRLDLEEPVDRLPLLDDGGDLKGERENHTSWT